MSRRRYVVVAGVVLAVAGSVLLGLGLTATSYKPPSLPVKAAEGVPSVTPSVTPSAVAYPRVTPVRVIVPSLSINAAVEPVGLCPSTNPDEDCSGVSSGGLATPALGTRNLTGWWDGGWAPGQGGAAVIVGHINSAAAGDLVFASLDSVKVGAMIETEPGNLMFRVTGTQEPAKDDAAFWTAFWQSDAKAGTPELQLITCGGPFDSATGHYTDNFIVYATRV